MPLSSSGLRIAASTAAINDEYTLNKHCIMWNVTY